MAVLFFVTAFFSEVAGTIAGFGSSTIFLPLALIFLDFRTALTLVAIFHVFGSIGRATFFRAGLDKKLLLSFGLPSVIFTVAGAALVNYAPQNLLKLLLGVFLTLFGAVSLLRPRFKFALGKFTAVFGGAISGFLAGLIGTGGALRGAFLTAFNLEKNVYIFTAAIIALAVDITRIPVYIVSGFLSSRFYFFIPLLFIAAITGSFAGKLVVGKLPRVVFRKIVLAVIIIFGLKFIWDFWR